MSVAFSRLVTEQGRRVRALDPLSPQRTMVPFFPLHSTVVPPIDETSRLHGATAQSLKESQAEFLILVTGTDETFSETVHSRSSYLGDEVIVGVRFKSMFVKAGDGRPRIDMRQFHEVEGSSERSARCRGGRPGLRGSRPS